MDAWLLSAVGAVGSAFNEISAVFIFTLATLAPCAEKVADWVLELAAAWKLLACNPPGAPRTKLQTCKLTLSTLPRQEAFVLKQAAKELQLDHDGSLMSISVDLWFDHDLQIRRSGTTDNFLGALLMAPVHTVWKILLPKSALVLKCFYHINILFCSFLCQLVSLRYIMHKCFSRLKGKPGNHIWFRNLGLTQPSWACTILHTTRTQIV